MRVNRFPSKKCKRILFASAFFTSALVFEGGAAAAEDQRTLQLDLQAQPVEATLQYLAHQFDLQVLFAPEAVESVQSPNVVGELTAAEAFDRALEGSGLTYEFTEASTILIRQAGGDSAFYASVGQASSGSPGSALYVEASVNTTGLSQDPDAGADSSDKEDRIVVTARRRDEDWRDVPLSVVVISGEELRQMGADRLRSLDGQVANMQFTGPDSFLQPSITVRGISSSARNIGFDAGIGIYVDEVYQGRPIAYDQPLFDIQQIEFLRGPQGTIFGKNTIAGAINIVTRKPGNEFEAKAQLEYGNHDYFRQYGSVEGPIVPDKLFASISVQNVDRDPYVVNEFLGQPDIGDLDRTAGRVQVLFTPNDQFEILAGFDAETADEAPYFQELIEGVGAVPGKHTTSQNADHLSRRDMFGGHLNLKYTLPSGFSITSVSAYRDVEIFGRLDQDVTPLDVLNSEFTDTQSFFTQELRVNSPQSNTFNYVVGVFYMNEELATDRDIIFGSLLSPIPIAATTIGSVDAYSIAGFANASWTILPHLTLDAGVRVTHEEKDLGLEHDFAPIMVFIPFFEDNYEDTNVSPTASLRYAVTDNVGAYFTFSSGYKSGGFNADFTPDPTMIEFNEETVKNYEAGIKGSFLNNRLIASAAGFFMQYNDLQVDQFVDFTSGFVIRNAARAEIKGAEFDFRAMPTDSLTLAGGFGYVDPVFKEFKDAGGPGVDFDGKQLNGASKWTAHASATYEFPVFTWGNGLIRGEMTYRGPYFQNNSNADTGKVSEATLVNARAEFTTKEEMVRIAFWADNIFDEDNQLQRFDVDFLAIGLQRTTVFGPPRMYGVTVTLQL